MSERGADTSIGTVKTRLVRMSGHTQPVGELFDLSSPEIHQHATLSTPTGWLSALELQEGPQHRAANILLGPRLVTLGCGH